MKPYLSRNETLPFANSDFVNRMFTNNYPCNNLSVNALRKTSKNGVFSVEGPFRCQYPPFFGGKIRIILDNPIIACDEATASSHASFLSSHSLQGNGWRDRRWDSF